MIRILDGLGLIWSRTVRDCCKRDMAVVGLSEIWRLRNGLDALAKHWRMIP